MRGGRPAGPSRLRFLVLLGTAVLISSRAFSAWPGPDWAVSFTRTFGGDQRLEAVCVDSSGTAYCVYRNDSAQLMLARMVPPGVVAGDVEIAYSGAAVKRIAVDGSGNVLVAGEIAGTGTDLYVAKFDAVSGLIATPGWPVTYNATGSAAMTLGGLAVDSSGNVLVAGYYAGASDIDSVVVKYLADGTMGWEVSEDFGTDDYCLAVAADLAGSVFIAAACENGSKRYSRVKAYYSDGTAWGEDLFEITDPAGTDTDDNPRGLTHAGGYLYMGLDGEDAVSANHIMAAVKIDPAILATSPLDGSSAEAIGSMELAANNIGLVGGVVASASGTAYVAGMIYDSSVSPQNFDLVLIRFSGTQLEDGWTDTYDSGGSDGYGADLARAAPGLDEADNFYLAAGITASDCPAGSQDLYVQAYDETGTKTWSKNYDYSPRIGVLGAVLDSSGNEYVGIDSGENPAILQYDGTGTWQRLNTPDTGAYCRGRAGGIASDGLTVYMSLSVFDPATLGGEVRVAGFDGAGSQVALYVYDATADVRTGPLAADAAGNLYMAAVYENSGSDDIMVVKFAPGGSIAWDTPVNETVDDLPAAIAVDAGGVYILQTNRDSSPSSYRLTKLDLSGNKLWGYNYTGVGGRSASAQGVSVEESEVRIAGIETDVSGNSWGRLLTLSPTGTIIADRSYNGGQDAGFSAVSAGGPGIIYLAGNLSPSGLADYDMHPLSFGSGGVTRWATTYDSGEPTDHASALAITGSTIYMAGEAGSTVWLVKYTEPPTGALTGSALISATAMVSGGTVQVILTVTNTGTDSVTSLAPEYEINSGSSFLSLVAGPVPSGLPDLSAGSATSFVWTFSVSGSGAARITATVTGVDAGLSVPLFSAGSVAVQVLERANLAADLATIPEGAFIGTFFTIGITVTNTGDLVASGVASSIEINSGAGLVAPAGGPWPSGTVYIGPGASRTFTWTYSITAAGALSFTVSVTGEDGIGGGISVSRSKSVTAEWPAALSSQLTVAPISPDDRIGIGQWLTTELEVTNNGAQPAYAVTGELLPSGAGTLTLMDAWLGPTLLNPGDSSTFTWTYSAGGAGVVGLSVSASGEDMGAGITLWTSQFSSFEVVYPSELTAPGGVGVLKAPVRQSESITVTLYVENIGDLDAEDITAVAGPRVVVGQADKASLISGPAPAGPLTLASGNGQYFTWVFRADDSGIVYFTATAGGTDELSGRTVKVSAMSGPILIEPAALMVLRAKQFPERPKVGSDFNLWLEVENIGDIGAEYMEAGLEIRPSGETPGIAYIKAGPDPGGTITISSEGSVAFSWTMTALRVGEVDCVFSLTGSEAPPSVYPVLAGATIQVNIDPPFAEPTVIYPNPVRSGGALPGCLEGDCFNLVPKLEDDAVSVEVDVFDSGLHRVFSGTFPAVYRGGTITIQGLLKWAPGIYLVRVRATLVSGREQEFPVAKLVIKR